MTFPADIVFMFYTLDKQRNLKCFIPISEKNVAWQRGLGHVDTIFITNWNCALIFFEAHVIQGNLKPGEIGVINA